MRSRAVLIVPASLTNLKLLDAGETTPGSAPQFLHIERGSWVYATEYSTDAVEDDVS